MLKRPLPKSCSCLQPLFRGELFAIDDWRCAGHDSPGLHEEWCAEDRIVITRRGVWQLSSAGKTYTADPLQAMLWPGQSGFRVSHPNGGADDCTVIRLTDKGSRAIREVFAKQGADDCSPTFDHRMTTLSQQSFALHWRLLMATRSVNTSGHALSKTQANVLAIEQACHALLMDICKPDGNVVPVCSKHAIHVAHHARAVIADRFCEALSLSAIADTVGCSSFYLAHQFKRVFGVSLHQAQVTLRLRVGLSQVLEQPTEIGRIAVDLGFASHSHFSDAFRAQFGCAPNQARLKFKQFRHGGKVVT